MPGQKGRQWRAGYDDMLADRKGCNQLVKRADVRFASIPDADFIDRGARVITVKPERRTNTPLTLWLASYPTPYLAKLEWGDPHKIDAAIPTRNRTKTPNTQPKEVCFFVQAAASGFEA